MDNYSDIPGEGSKMLLNRDGSIWWSRVGGIYPLIVGWKLQECSSNVLLDDFQLWFFRRAMRDGLIDTTLLGEYSALPAHLKKPAIMSISRSSALE